MSLDDLNIFYGDTSEQASLIYAQLPGMDTAQYNLSGSIRGPFCEHGRTLPTNTKLTDLGPGDSLLASASIIDPCFWSPETPSLYQVHIELRKDGRVLETAQRTIGIRNLGVRGKNLFLNGRRWVLRGTSRRSTADTLPSWREYAMAMLVDGVDDELGCRSSREGVFVVPRVDTSEPLNRYSRWASVGIVIVGTERLEHDLAKVIPNVLLAQLLPANDPFTVATWADLVVGEVDSPAQFGERFAQGELPVIAMRRYDDNADVADCRAACDRLQRDLAPFGDFAGYMV